MDVPRDPNELKKSRRRRGLVATVSVVALAAVLYGASRLGRAAADVSTQGLWVDTVLVGDVARELYGVGELVPDYARRNAEWLEEQRALRKRDGHGGGRSLDGRTDFAERKHRRYLAL